ncbi:MAG: ornithine cyclodeaminase family protein [Anaerolineae bacterium]|nr:ornithine cyclodeaminase family protein [Anaerolineales bacterium]MCQ3978977.1 ornithine cyclodeaminase family protein [Anaerolineae bacterium]
MALLLTRSDVEAALPMVECIASQEYAFREHGLGNAVTPHRLGLKTPGQDGLYIAMPSYLGGDPSGAMAVKVLTFYPNNPAAGLPAITATVLLHDPNTGALLAIMDGASITGLRTAAGSAVATKYLARAEASTVGILGSGVQAETHLVAMCAVRPVQTAWVYSRDRDRRTDFAERMTARLGIEVTPVSSARAAVEGAEIVVTATTAREPIVDGDWFAPGVHINCVGSGIPDRRELDDKIVQRAKIVVDTYDSALAEAGDLLIPIAQGLITQRALHADLGEILTGQKVGRTDEAEITIFKSVGVALQDVGAAAWIYRRAKELGLGQVVDF